MDREALVAACLARPGAWLDEPWDNDQVAKVGDKIFAFLGAEAPELWVGLKCGRNREEADEWLLEYPDDAVISPYIGRYGWNRLRVGGAVPDDELLETLQASYEATVRKLPVKDRPTLSAPQE